MWEKIQATPLASLCPYSAEEWSCCGNVANYSPDKSLHLSTLLSYFHAASRKKRHFLSWSLSFASKIQEEDLVKEEEISKNSCHRGRGRWTQKLHGRVLLPYSVTAISERTEFTLRNPISFQIHQKETNHVTASLLLFFFPSELPAQFLAQSWGGPSTGSPLLFSTFAFESVEGRLKFVF